MHSRRHWLNGLLSANPDCRDVPTAVVEMAFNRAIGGQLPSHTSIHRRVLIFVRSVLFVVIPLCGDPAMSERRRKDRYDVVERT